MFQDMMVTPSPAPSFDCRSAAHIVLAIPELLKIILSFGTQASNASYALVCRGWLEPALDNVWREVDDMYYSVRLLAPLSPPYSYSIEFSRIPTAEDWSRFMHHARRVHSLKYGIKRNEKAKHFQDSVFHDLCYTRGALEVLPNLRSLWWNSIPKARYAALFMHNKVTKFSFEFNSENLPSLRTNIVGRMPSLRSLGWTEFDNTGSGPLKENKQELLQLLPSLQNLREVAPPKGVLDSKFSEALSFLPELEVIQYDNLGGISCYPIPDLKCTLQEGAFPKLYDLRLNSDLDDIRVYLTGGALLPRLRNLSVESMRELPLTVQKFLKDVTRCYPTLEMVSMDIIINIEDQGDCKPLSPEHLYPILSLQQLTHLELRHNQPLQISEVDLAELGAALPALEKLVLNPEPLQLMKPKITLHSLLIIAQHFPKLFYLGIYLDAQINTTVPMPHSPTKTGLFPNLLTLHVGVSPIASEEPVAIFLSYLFLEMENKKVEIRSGISWDSTLYKEDVEYKATISKHRNIWDKVRSHLPLLLQLHKEKALEVKDLQIKIEDLEANMEKIRMN